MLWESKYDKNVLKGRTVNTLQFNWCIFLTLPDIQADEVRPGEYVVASEHHADVRYEDILGNLQRKPWHMCTH